MGGLIYSGVSQVCRRIEEKIKRDSKFRKKIEFSNGKMSNIKTDPNSYSEEELEIKKLNSLVGV